MKKMMKNKGDSGSRLCGPALFVLVLGIIVLVIQIVYMNSAVYVNTTNKSKTMQVVEEILMLIVKVAVVQLLCNIGLGWLAWTLIVLQFLVGAFYMGLLSGYLSAGAKAVSYIGSRTGLESDVNTVLDAVAKMTKKPENYSNNDLMFA